MSEKISRRVFLKATGFAALSVAAAGVLGGCDISPLPENATFTDFSNPATVSAENPYYISATALSNEWTSYAASFESDGTIHHYVYLGLRISEPNSEFKITKSNLSCSAGKIFGFGNIILNDSSKYTTSLPELTVTPGGTKTVPLYIDLGDKSISSLSSLEIRLTAYKKTVTLHYEPIGFLPDISQ